MHRTKLVICPYCGDAQPGAARCRACGGQFEVLSRRASHNAMGPWYLRDPKRPFNPGFSYETMVKLIARGTITEHSILRGPTTRQFWNVARRVPGAAHLLGRCHACDGRVDPDDHGCAHCGVPFGAILERNYLGLPDVRPMPDDVDALDDTDHLLAGSGDEDLALQPFDRETGRGAMSSFATNRELFAVRPPVRDAAPDASARAAAATLAPANGSGAPGPSAVTIDEVLRHPAVRSLQRRFEQQRRVLRALWILCAVGIVLVGLLAFVAVRSSRVVHPTVTPIPGASPSATSPPPEPVIAPGVGAPDGNASETVPGVTDHDAATRDRTPAQERYETAWALFASALDRSRPIAERLGDANSALELVRDVQRILPEEAWPEGLEGRIARMEAEIERLELKRYFGGPGG